MTDTDRRLAEIERRLQALEDGLPSDRKLKMSQWIDGRLVEVVIPATLDGVCKVLAKHDSWKFEMVPSWISYSPGHEPAKTEEST